MHQIIFALCAAALLGLGAPAQAADIEIIQPWVRVNPGSGTGALYFTLHNAGADSDRLVAATTPMARRADLHASMAERNIVRMEKLNGIEVSAGGSVPFQPGGLHVMLTGLDAAAKPGRSLPVTLRFERAGERTIAAPILAPGAEPPSAMGPAGMQGTVGHGRH